MAIAERDEFDRQMLVLVNTERTRAGLRPVILSQKLDTAADQYADRMATGDFFAEVDPRTGDNVGDRARDEGYDWTEIRELIAGGQTTAAKVFEDWFESARGKATILSRNVTHLGVGYRFLANDPGQVKAKHYWSLVLGDGGQPGNYRPDGTSPPPSGGKIFGTPRADRLEGRAANDVIFGLAGNDTLLGLGGNDRLLGGDGNDKLVGDDGNDTLVGGAGNDSLIGGDGRDVLVGVDASERTLVGRGEVDVLTGGAGTEQFVLGDRRTTYYNDGSPGTRGLQDYALIRDFSRTDGDQIQLHGSASNYRLQAAGGGFPDGTLIFLITGRTQELIGVVEQVTLLNPRTDAFVYLV